VQVVHGWDDRFGLNQPKWNRGREIPVSAKVAASLQALIALSPFQEPEHLVFWGRNGEHPLTKTTLLKGLKRALIRAGIPEKDRQKQNYCFRSWERGFSVHRESNINRSIQ
jgi:hypothetical protein